MSTLPLFWFGLCFWAILLCFILIWFLSTQLICFYDKNFWFRIPIRQFLGWFQVRWTDWVTTVLLSEKNAANNMAESKIPMHDLIFRCGWDTKSLHTIFNYIFTSLSNDMRCEKTLAHWFFKQSNEIYGEYLQPLTIKNRTWFCDFFVHLLFVHRTQLKHKNKFKRILEC